MKDYAEILCYSEKQRDLIKTHGSDAGVVLIDGEELPRLTTETVTNMRTPSMFEREEGEPEEPVRLKSNWEDAIVVLRSDGNGYSRLVNGLGVVTNAGKDWCAAHNTEPTPEALRWAAEQQDCVRRPMKVMKALHLRKAQRP